MSFSADYPMIYFENHCRGITGLNNHVVCYTLCIAISNFLDRDFYFEYEPPTIALPDLRAEGTLRSAIEHVTKAERSLVSDLLDIPARRVLEIDRSITNKLRVDDPMLTFMTDGAQREKFQSTMIWDYFSLGRSPLVKEDLQERDLIELGPNCMINSTYYFFLPRVAKKQLLDSIKIRYKPAFEELAAKIVSTFGRYNAIHMRLGDFPRVYGPDGFLVKPEKFARYLQAKLQDRSLPVLVATDEFQNKEIFAKLLDGFQYRFIDEIILGEYSAEFESLPFSDFNVLSILDQLICAASENFVGTCRSTFTGIIHRMRQERYGKNDFNLFPDERVQRHLDADFRWVPDGQGFFDWNRYSAFAEYYEFAAWMREWDYDLSAV